MSNGIKIESGIPIPKSRLSLYHLLSEMKVGDSFLIPRDPDVHIRVQQCRASVATNGFRRRNNKLDAKFVTRTVDVGVRVWRVK